MIFFTFLNSERFGRSQFINQFKQMKSENITLLSWALIIIISLATHYSVKSSNQLYNSKIQKGICLADANPTGHLCALCTKKADLDGLSHKGFTVHADQPFHAIKFKSKTYLQCQQFLQTINQKALSNDNIFLIEDVNPIIELFKSEKAQTDRKEYRKISVSHLYEQIVLFQLSQTSNINVKITYPNPEAHEDMLEFVKIIAFAGIVFSLAIELIKIATKMEIQLTSFCNVALNAGTFYFIYNQDEINLDQKAFTLIIGLFYITVLLRNLSNYVLIALFATVFALINLGPLVLIIQLFAVGSLVLGSPKNVVSLSNPVFTLSLSALICFLINQYVLRISLQNEQDNFSIIFQFTVLAIVPTALELTTILDHHSQISQNGMKVADEEISELKTEGLHHAEHEDG